MLQSITVCRGILSRPAMVLLAMALWMTVVPASAATTVTIEPIVKHIGSTGDQAPGRPTGFRFWGESDVQFPAINDAGQVVFRGFTAGLNPNDQGAFGIYAHRPGFPLAVLVDSTLDSSGNPTFAVPGQLAGTRFQSSGLGAPLLNNSGDVLFHARFFNPTTGLSGSGVYATTTAGGTTAIVKIADTTDAVPGVAGQVFSGFLSPVSIAIEGLTHAVLNDSGAVAFYGAFPGFQHGLYASSVTGAPPIMLADTTQSVVPTGFLTSGGFRDIRPEFALSNAGIVAFHGFIGSSFSSGVFSVPVTGGTPQTVASRFDPIPGSAANFFSFDAQDINEAGQVLFQGNPSGGSNGLYAGDAAGGALSVIADTLGGFIPPGNDPAATFNGIFLGPLNESGGVGFIARITNAGNANSQGLYLGDLSGSPVGLVTDTTQPAPGLVPAANLTDFLGFAGNTPAINDAGSLAFSAKADFTGGSVRGLYFFDACAGEAVRIVDSTTSLSLLGSTFSTAGSQIKQLDLYQGKDAISGHYRGLNNSNDVAFLAQFSNSEFGIYVAHITAGGTRGVLFVDDTATGANNGSSWANAYNTLQDALADAASPTCPASGIWVAAGTYKPDQGANQTAGNRSETFQMLSGVEIYGGFAGTEDPATFDLTTRDFTANETILTGDLTGDDAPGFTNNADNSLHVVTATGTDDTARLDGFTITAGNADATTNPDRCGGGLLNWRVSGPSATSGATVANCSLRNNKAEFGGGAISGNGSTITFDNTEFIANLGAQQGGGMYLSNATPTPTLRNCTFAGNSSVTGGGLYVNQGATVTGCVFTGNVASNVASTSTGVGGGGGIFTIAVRDSFFLSNSTFSGNVAKRGAGLHNSFGGPLNRPRVHNCVFWGNTASVEGNELFNFGSTAFVQNCDIQGSGSSGTGWDTLVGRDDGGNIDADPRFEDANGADNVTGTVDDDLRLACGSPAIDAGNDALVPAIATTDLDGQPRIAGTAVNMGAYESQPVGTGQIAITCPVDLAALECGGDTSPAATGAASAVEDCLGASVATAFTDVSVSACGGTETITRTWTAGGSASCVQIITSVDTTAPVLTLPVDVTIECDASTDPSNTGQATASDVCDAAPAFTFTDVVTPSAVCGQSRVIARTWTATDACGNGSSAVQTITVVDTTAPTLTIPADVTVSCGASTAPSSTGQATIADNCDAAPTLSSSDSVAPGACPQNSVITRTWTGTDACGNAVSGVQTITVVDSIAPALIVPLDATVECDADSSPAATGNATATDNCDLLPTVASADTVAAGICPQASVITRTWTATDACGNASSTIQTINVVDSTAPVVSLVGAGTVVLAGCVGDTYVELGANAADNCDTGPIAVTVGGDTVDTSLPASFTISYDATDACGNAAVQVTRTVNVVDSSAPTFTSLPTDLTVECQGSGGVPATDPAIVGFLGMATATDACDPVVGITNDAPATFPFGPTAVTWTATDSAGNNFMASRVVTVVDTTAPVVTCPAAITAFADAACQTAIPDVTTGVTASDNCSGASALAVSQSPATGTLVTLGAHAITVTVTDGSGNSGSCSVSLTVVDDTAPTVTPPLAATVECDQPSDPSATGSAVAADNCDPSPAVTFTDGTLASVCPELSTITRTWSATDASGNAASADQVVSVVDTTAPGLTCPATVSTSGGFGGTIVTFSPTAIDACDPAPSVVSAPPSGSFFATGVTGVTATATDACTNASTCGLDVLVSCFGVNRAKIGTKDTACRGIEEIKFASMDGTEELISLFKADEGSGGGVEEDTLPASIVVDDGVNGPVTVDTSCGQAIHIGDVFGPYVVADIEADFDEHAGEHGNEVELKGSFVPAVAFDLAIDDMVFTIDDGQGHTAAFTIPAGSFQVDGKPEKGKLKFEGNVGVADVKAKLEGCKFSFKAKNATNTGQLVGTAMTVALVVGPNLGSETLAMEDKVNHLKFKRQPKINCCPECVGVASMQVTSDQGVLVFTPAAGQSKLSANTVVDDGVNGSVTVHTSCSQAIEAGMVVGPYTISEVIKVFEQGN